ncbi:hypothetical protein Tco_0891630 [Tanacetum coccineum]|uniref:Uncharacterized protein n=1 Tax=Tanacetum coccineum TaxID=301880 RepID=A0ABQ5C6T4_9ASTR
MEFKSAQSNTTAKLPILKLGEYEMWVIRIKQYFQVQDYPLWEVIENGNSWVSVPQTAQENGTSDTKMPVHVTAEEKTNKKNDVKARSLLLMALPNEHQLTFSQYSDAKTMFAAIKTQFGVWMNKADIETMSIDDLYNNFKIVEQDVKKSVGASSGAQNLAFMTASSTSSTNDVNTANPAYEVSTVSPNINTAYLQVSTDNFSDNTMYAFMVENPNGSNLLQQDLEQIHEDDPEAIDLKWQLSAKYEGKKIGHFSRECRAPKNKEGQFRYQDNTRKQGNNEDTSSKAMLAIDGVATTYKRGLATIEEQLVTYKKNEVLFSKEVAVLKREVACKDYEINVLKNKFEKVKQEKEGIEFQVEKFNNASKSLDKLLGNPEFKSYGSKDSELEYNIVCDKKSDDSKENSDDSFVKEQVSKDTSSFVESLLNVDKETIFLVDKKIEFVKPKNHEKLVKKSVMYAEMSFDHVQITCNYHQKERMVSRNNYNRVDYDYYSKTTHPSAHRNMTPRAVLLKISLTPLNIVRPVNTAHPKLAVHSAKSMSHFSKQAQSTDQRPFYKKTTLTSRYVNQKLNTAMRHYHTERPGAVNTARSYTAPVNVVRAKRVNDVKASAGQAITG